MEISDVVGLGQSSLYYWFKRKELILAELLQQVNRLPLAFAKQLERAPEGADLQLYRLIRFDVHTVCTFPLEITEIHRFSHRDPAAFETYWLERAQLIHAIERFVERGVSSGAFSEVDAYLTAVTIISQDESVQNWYPRPMQPALSVHPKVDRARTYEPKAIAEFVATTDHCRFADQVFAARNAEKAGPERVVAAECSGRRHKANHVGVKGLEPRRATPALSRWILLLSACAAAQMTRAEHHREAHQQTRA